MPYINETPLYSVVDTDFDLPIYDNEPKQSDADIKATYPHEVDRDGGVWSAAGRVENATYGLYKHITKPNYAPEEAFDSDVIDKSMFDTRRRHLLIGAQSEPEYSYFLHQFEQEDLDQSVLDDGGASALLAQITSGAVSFETAIPILGWTAKASLGKNLAVAGGNALAVEGARSAFLYSEQSNRTVEQAITEAALATVFAGGLAAVAHGGGKVVDDVVDRSIEYNRGVANEAHKSFEITNDLGDQYTHTVDTITQQMSINEVNIPYNHSAIEARIEAALTGNGDTEAMKRALVAEGYDQKMVDDLAGDDLSDIEGQVGAPTAQGGDGGAAYATDRPDIEATKVVNRGLVKALGAGPMIRLATSTNHAIRTAAYKLYDDGLLRVGDANGWLVKDDVSTGIKGWGKDIGDIIDSEVNQYQKYTTRQKGLGETPIPIEEFRTRVSRSMRRDDVDDISEVAAVAKQIRKYFNKVSTKGRDTGLFTENLDVKFAISYFPRAYDLEKLSTFEGERLFTDKVAQGIQRKFPDMEDDIAEWKAEKILANIMGDSDTVFEGVVEGVKGSALKARVLDFDDEFLEEFLKNDYREILMNYHRSIVPAIEMRKRFDTTSMHKMMEDARIERDEQLAAAGTDNKARKKIYKEYKQNEQDIELVLRRMGVKKKPDGITTWAQPVSKFIKTFNNVTSLGGVAISSIPDLARLTLYNGFKPLAKTLAMIVAKPSLYKMAIVEKRQFVAALDMVTNQRLSMIAGGDDYGMAPASSKIMKGVDMVNDKFFTATGMRHWNTNLKAVNAQIQTDKIVSIYNRVKTGNKLTTKEVTRLNELGIDNDTLIRLGKKVDEFGEIQNDLTIINMDKWGDDNLADLVKQALIRDSDQKIITINEADLYSAFDDPVLSLFLQYKSFAMAAWNRVLVSGIQRGDMDSLMQMVMLLGMGAVTTQAKRALNGDDSEISAGKLFLESIDNSGAATALMELSRNTELMTGNEHGLYAWTGNGRQVRNYNLNAGNAFGPSVGKFNAIAQSTANVAQGKELPKTAWTLLPINNHPIVKVARVAFEDK